MVPRLRKTTPTPLTPATRPTTALDPAIIAAATGPRNEVDFGRLWKALYRRRVPFLATLLGFIAFVGIATLLMPKSYTTQVKLIVGDSSTGDVQSSSDFSVLNALRAGGGVQTSETIAELLGQTPIAQSVVDNLKLPISAPGLLSHVTIKPVSDTSIIGVSVAWPDRVMSARIANEYATVFVASERSLVTRQADASAASIQEQLPVAEENMHQAQANLAAYQRKTGLADATIQTNNELNSASALDARYSASQIDQRSAQAQLTEVQNQLASVPQTIVGASTTQSNPVAAQLQTQIAQTTMELAQARQQYTETHPQVVLLKERLAEQKRQLAAQPVSVAAGSQSVPNPVYEELRQEESTLKAKISAASAEQATMNGARANITKQIALLPEQSRRISELSREAKDTEQIYTQLKHKYEDSMLAKTTALSNVTITQTADPSIASVTPNLFLNVSLATVIGLVLGLTVAFGLEFFDDRLRTAEDVKDRIGLPVLATIPQLAPADPKNGGWVESMTVEAFFQLVTALRYSSENPPRVISISSPGQGDGKSTIAINIAISMASLNAKVLVIDADLRRPTIHTKLRISNDAGLSDVLVGVANFNDAIKPSGHPGVWTLTGGMRPPNPVALLQSEAFDRVVNQARELFDFVILDAPALGSIIDGVMIGMKADGTVLVVSAEQTDGRAAEMALAKLRAVQGLNILGVVLNQTTPDPSEYSDYYLGSGQTISLPNVPSSPQNGSAEPPAEPT